jgi:fibronectin-binding autotransporter adhesin
MSNINGYNISASNPNLTINVATGSTLAITTPIYGTGNLVKGDSGVLTLSGANSYSGSTNINAGTLTLGATNAIPDSSAVAIASGSTFNLNNFNETVGSIAGAGNITLGSASLVAGGNNTSTSFSGVISGTGTFEKTGTGTLTLSGTNTYTGVTTVSAGVLDLTGSVTSNTSIASAGTLSGGGTINGTLTNAGDIAPGLSGTRSNLTVTGTYTGQGGTLTSNVYAPPSGTPLADQLIIGGNASGTTGIRVVDKGGLGLPTTGNGIQVIQTGGGNGTFTLSGRAASGAYEYYLYKGGVSGSPNNWFLRTDDPTPPVVVVTPDVRNRIEVAVYPALPSLIRLYAMNSVDSLDQRRTDLVSMTSSKNSPPQSGWARIIGRQGSSNPTTIDQGPKIDFNSYGIQAGVDLYQNEQAGSRTYIGPIFTFGGTGSSTFNQANTVNTGKMSMLAYSFGLNAIHFNSNGAYVDALGQITRFENIRAASTENADIFTKGWGATASLETGLKVPLNSFWSVTPQAQIVIDSINIDPTNDAYGQISFTKDNLARARVGLMLAHQKITAEQNIKGWLRASIWDVFKGSTNTTFSSLYGENAIAFQSSTASRWLALDTGLTAQFSKNSSAFINLGWDSSLNSTYHSIYGKVGIQTRWQ